MRLSLIFSKILRNEGDHAKKCIEWSILFMLQKRKELAKLSLISAFDSGL
jgi:hypothetical protein